MLSLDKAIIFAAQAHTGQKDKGNNSYVRHVLRVMESMDSEDEMIVAVLHDVVEDTPTTLDDLKGLGCTEAQVMAIDALTKKPGQTPEEYVALVKKSKTATKVKIADIKDNTQLWRMKNKENFGDKDAARLKKYFWMLTQLGVS
jgi:(p)ppGpp synthase/HD superfamily hydrolase